MEQHLAFAQVPHPHTTSSLVQGRTFHFPYLIGHTQRNCPEQWRICSSTGVDYKLQSESDPSIHESLWRSFVDGSPAGPGTEFFLTITTTSITSTTTSFSTITGRVYVKA